MTVTHDTASTAKAAPSISQRRQRSMLGNTWRGFVKAPLSAKFGMLIIAVYVFAAIFAPALAPYGEAEVVGAGYQPWSWQYLMGTDQLGRDLFSRLIYGARNTALRCSRRSFRSHWAAAWACWRQSPRAGSIRS